MKTWIDWMNRIAGGMLFQGGYVATPRMLVAGQAAQVARDEHPEPAAEQRAGHDYQGQRQRQPA